VATDTAWTVVPVEPLADGAPEDGASGLDDDDPELATMTIPAATSASKTAMITSRIGRSRRRLLTPTPSLTVDIVTSGSIRTAQSRPPGGGR
jgi:hypothetical protein